MTADFLTVEEFEALPDEVIAHHELVDGRLVETPSLTFGNSLTRDNLRFLFTLYLRERQIGGAAVCEMDVQTGEHTVRRPDVSLFSADQVSRIDLDAVPVPEPPMIAVEVLSPSED